MRKRGKYKIVKQNSGWFKKGSEPHNKGENFVHSGSFKAGHEAYSGIEKTQFKSKPWTFKGTISECKALHHWVNKEKGKAYECLFSSIECRGGYQWANKSGHYKKEISDYIPLCAKHHFDYDKGGVNINYA